MAATLVEMLVDRVRASGNKPALWFKRDQAFQALTWEELFRRICRAAAGLIRLGVQPGDRVIQLSENRHEWVIADFAIQMAQAVHVPVHAPLTAEQVAFQIIDSGARTILVSTSDQLAKLQAAESQFDRELQVFCYDSLTGSVAGREVSPLASLFELPGEDLARDAEQRALDALTPDSMVTILYTSGTTGQPKGVVLNQHNLVTNTRATVEAIGFLPEDRRLNFLPFSHIFARTCDIYTWVAAGTELAIAESRETVIADCALTQPTVLNGVPYFFDRVRRSLLEAGQDSAEALRQVLGGRVRYCCSGGAALPEHVFDFYQERGVPILQGYGLTETSPVISVSTQEYCRRGASGRAISGVEVRTADDGEILTRGPHVMVGYYRQAEATAEVIRDGWFYTGDLGRVDEDGFLYITGRKKEIIVTSGGKNVSPVLLESLLAEDPLILQALVIGDDRSYLAALIVPNPEELRNEIDRRRLDIAEPETALQHPQIRGLYEQCIGERLKRVSYYEQVRKFTLLSRPFSIEQGEMTPKMSLRRKVIEEHFAQEIEDMYSRNDSK